MISSYGEGTSCSAAHVTGALALIAQQSPTLAAIPSALKAIITAGVNKTNHHYIPSQRILSSSQYDPASSYVQYGSGIIDCLTNKNIVSNNKFDYGVFNSNALYSTIEINCTSGQLTRFSIVSENQCTTPNSSEICCPDYDLEVRDPSGQIVTTASTGNNVEIVEFTPTSTGIYTIYIDRSNMIGTSTYYGLAWG